MAQINFEDYPHVVIDDGTSIYAVLACDLERLEEELEEGFEVIKAFRTMEEAFEFEDQLKED